MRSALLLLLASCCFGYGACVRWWNTGAGIICRLDVTQDVSLERESNFNYLEFLLVGQHYGYPNKRSLIQMEDLPSNCTQIQWAKMYVYSVYAHKASWDTIQQSPYISRPIEVYQVKDSWDEAQATITKRNNTNDWMVQHLDQNGQDAGPDVIDTVTWFTSRPSGFMEFDVTDAMKNWQNGDPNNGVLLRASNELTVGRDLRFYSNAYSNATRHAFTNVLCENVGNQILATS